MSVRVCGWGLASGQGGYDNEGMGVAGVLLAGMQRRGVKPADVSRETGISEATLSRILAGKRQPRYSTLVLLARYLQLDWAEIEAAQRGSVEPPPPESPDVLLRRTQVAIRREREALEAQVRQLRERSATGVAAAVGRIIRVPLVNQSPSAGLGTEVEPETVEYVSTDDTAQYIAVRIAGHCLEPDIHSGSVGIVDTTHVTNIPDGRLVLAMHDDEAFVKWLRTDSDGSRWLESNTEPRIRINDTTRIGGVVVSVQVDPTRRQA